MTSAIPSRMTILYLLYLLPTELLSNSGLLPFLASSIQNAKLSARLIRSTDLIVCYCLPFEQTALSSLSKKNKMPGSSCDNKRTVINFKLMVSHEQYSF